MSSLVLFGSLETDEVLQSLLQKDDDCTSYLLSQALMQYPLGKPVLANYLLDQLLASKNLFAVTASNQQILPTSLIQAAAAEIQFLQQLVQDYAEPAWLADSAHAEIQHGNEYYQEIAQQFTGWPQQIPTEVVKTMHRFHQQHGFGSLVRHRVWRWQGRLVGVAHPDPIRLEDLIGYQYQKQMVIQNTELFLYHNRGNNVLLSGERGTGKSSLIKAIANEYGNQGLSLLEVPRNYLAELPKILDLLKQQPRHYILFIDDLSFDQADQEYKELKAILEGGVEALSDHLLLYATSNRKHLVYESWQDRQGIQHDENGDVRLGDTMAEKLSLSDRFGLSLNFISPNQEEYLDIVHGIAKTQGIQMPPAELEKQALQWARWQNNPSGRTARQFIQSLVVSE